MVDANVDRQRAEALGPAERIINMLTNEAGHIYHNRPGIVINDRRQVAGVRWEPVTHKVENGQKVVYHLVKVGRKNRRIRIGIMDDNGVVRDNGRRVGEYRSPGLFPEVAGFLYSEIARVWQMDNEFVARWASWAFKQEHRDLKTLLAAFSLVQSRCGEPVREEGVVLFNDDDYREIGEAMCLIRLGGNRDISPKLLLRIGDILKIPQIAKVNRELGFGRSAKNAAMGRYNKTVTKWLNYRENNIPMLNGLVRAGYRRTVIALCQRVGYKPQSAAFFQTLRWRQIQSRDGRRTIAIGADVAEAETWEGMSEEEICERIVGTRPSFKRISGLIGTSNVGLTRAVMYAAIEAGSLTDSDVIIITPTLEELGLLKVQAIRERLEAAVAKADNQRALNIARRVRGKENIKMLEDAADNATKRALAEVTKDIRIYVIVDKSGSMQGAIEKAKAYCARFLQGIPLERLHISIFNTKGVELRVRHASAAGVNHAFRGHKAGGGTVYAAGVKALQHNKPRENEDALMIFIGDQANSGPQNFAPTVRNSGLNPVAFGLIEVIGSWGTKGRAVENTAEMLGIPCFRIEESTFDDPYAITRTMRNLIAATPVGQPAAGVARRRVSLIETILQTDLLTRPRWA